MNHNQNKNMPWKIRKKQKAMRLLMTLAAVLVIATTLTTIAAKVVYNRKHTLSFSKNMSQNQYLHQYDSNLIHDQDILESNPRFLKNKNKNYDDDDNDDGDDDGNTSKKKKKKKNKKKNKNNDDDDNDNSYPSSYKSSYGSNYGSSSYGSSSYGSSYRNSNDDDADNDDSDDKSNKEKGSIWSLSWLFGGNMKSNDDYTSKYRSSAYGNYGTGYGYSSSTSSNSYSSYGSEDEDVGVIVLVVFLFFVSTLSAMLYTAHAFTQHPDGTFVNCCLLSLNSADMFYRIAYNVYNCRLSEVVDIICPGEDDDEYTDEELERMKLRPGIERVLDKEHLKAMKNMEVEMGNYDKKTSWRNSFGM